MGMNENYLDLVKILKVEMAKNEFSIFAMSDALEYMFVSWVIHLGVDRKSFQKLVMASYDEQKKHEDKP